MKTDEIKKILEAFYNGETSIEEEMQLLRYFESEEVADELLIEKQLFIGLHRSQPIEIPEKLEKNLEDLIDNLEQEEGIREKNGLHARIMPKRPVKSRLALIAALAVAASLLLVFVVRLQMTDGSGLSQLPAKECMTELDDEPEDTFNNPADAQRAAEEALMKVSVNLNKGFGELSFATTSYRETKTRIDSNKLN